MFARILLFRAYLKGDTQKIEGANNTIQEVTRQAPRIQLALTSARVSWKAGASVTPIQCAEVHTEVLVALESFWNMDQIAVVHSTRWPECPPEPSVAETAVDADLLQACALAKHMAQLTEPGHMHVYAIETGESREEAGVDHDALQMRQFRRTRFVARGTVNPDGPQLSLNSRQLHEFLLDVACASRSVKLRTCDAQ